ncbi:MAG: hypothetical protein ACI4GC_00765 [Acutalibacteraceae bacterium]
MTAKKLCGLRSVPFLFRVSPIWSAFCRPVRRGHEKETALLYGRVAGRFTLSVKARSLRSLAIGSVVSLRSPPSAFRSLRSFSAAALPALASLRPPAFQAFDLRFAVPLAPLVRSPFHSEKESGIFEKKERSGERTFFSKMECLVFSPYPLRKNMKANKYFT